jgi:hypothetical protein
VVANAVASPLLFFNLYFTTPLHCTLPFKSVK